MCPVPTEQSRSLAEKPYPKPPHQLTCFDAIDTDPCHTSLPQQESKLAEQGLKQQQPLGSHNGFSENSFTRRWRVQGML